MRPKRFPSKVDTWLLIVFAGVVILQIVIVAMAVAETGEPVGALIGVGSVFLIIVLFGSLLKFTYYDVEANHLRIVAGPFRWRIPRDQITAIEPTRSPLSSPALSLDRLRIRYGNRRRVLVSPADKRGFLNAMGFGEKKAHG